MPREYPEAGLIEMSSKVPKEHYERFIGLFPQHGATSWFIRTALEKFLSEVENEPSSVDRIQEAIRESIRTA